VPRAAFQEKKRFFTAFLDFCFLDLYFLANNKKINRQSTKYPAPPHAINYYIWSNIDDVQTIGPNRLEKK
jgi:hypothetical protein